MLERVTRSAMRLVLSTLLAASVLHHTTVVAAPLSLSFTRLSYEGQQVLNCTLTTHEHLELIRNYTMDVWSDDAIAVLDQPVELRADFIQRQALFDRGVECDVVISDLDTTIAAHYAADTDPGGASTTFHVRRADVDAFFTKFRTYDDFKAKIAEWAKAFPDLFTDLGSIGKTHDGRDIPAFKISRRPAAPPPGPKTCSSTSSQPQSGAVHTRDLSRRDMREYHRWGYHRVSPCHNHTTSARTLLPTETSTRVVPTSDGRTTSEETSASNSRSVETAHSTRSSAESPSPSTTIPSTTPPSTSPSSSSRPSTTPPLTTSPPTPSTTNTQTRSTTTTLCGGDTPPPPPKKSVWLNGGIHAREWISPSTVMFLAWALLTGIPDKKFPDLLDKVDFYFTPISNPDGYVYTFTTDRMWRKNRSPNANSPCIGTDLNRNWDEHWNKVGTGKSPCEDIWAGSGPFSEKETKALSAFVLNKIPNKIAGIDFHSYGQLILTPWGWTKTKPANQKYYSTLGTTVRDAIQAQSGVMYTPQLGADLYLASGTTDDWMNAKAGIVGLTIELRDLGRKGFLLPATEIVPVGTEMVKGVEAFVQYVLANPAAPLVPPEN